MYLAGLNLNFQTHNSVLSVAKCYPEILDHYACSRKSWTHVSSLTIVEHGSWTDDRMDIGTKVYQYSCEYYKVFKLY